MPADPDERLRRQVRTQRQLGWLTLGLAGGTGLCWLRGFLPGFLVGLLVTTVALVAWVLAPPWQNPFDPD